MDELKEKVVNKTEALINPAIILVWFKRTDHSHEGKAKHITVCPASVDGNQRMTEQRLFNCVLSEMNCLESIKPCFY